jgi:hypothetical protein
VSAARPLHSAFGITGEARGMELQGIAPPVPCELRTRIAPSSLRRAGKQPLELELGQLGGRPRVGR